MNSYIEDFVGDEDEACVNNTFLVCYVKDRLQQALLTHLEANDKMDVTEARLIVEDELKKIIHEGSEKDFYFK